MSGNQNVLQISIELELESLWSELICPLFFGDSGGEFKQSIVAVNQYAAWLLRPGIVSAILVGVKYFSSSLDKP